MYFFKKFRGVIFKLGLFAFFLETSDKHDIHSYFRILYFVHWTTFWRLQNNRITWQRAVNNFVREEPVNDVVSHWRRLESTLTCTKDRSSHFCDCFLVSKWIFQHYDRGLTKFHAGCDQPLVCVVINNSSYPTVKNNNRAFHAFRKYWMQARGFLNYRLKYCWRKVIYCICLGFSDGRYFTGLAGILPLI